MSLLHLIALLLALHVALSDLYARRVSNRALLLALAAAMIALALSSAEPTAGAALLGGAIGLAALLPFHLLGWMGAGDVKFFAVLGVLLGWQALLPVWIVASLLAGVHAVVVLGARRLDLATRPQLAPLCALPLTNAWRQRRLAARQGRHGAPYAAYLAVGTGLLVLVPEWFAHG